MVRIRRVLVVGGGVCGSQIAWQCHAMGFEVFVLEADPKTASVARTRLIEAEKKYRLFVDSRDQETLPSCREIRVFDGWDADWPPVDFVFESIFEDLTLKRELFAELGRKSPPHTILATNSSYLTPSMLAHASGRPDRVIGFHFHIPVWYANAVDIMPHVRTSEETLKRSIELAIAINQVPIVTKREYPGYVFNSLLFPILSEAITLSRIGVVSPDQVDLAWRTITKMSIGPFGMMGEIGPATVEKILRQGAKRVRDTKLEQNANYLASMTKDQWNAIQTKESEIQRRKKAWVNAPIHKELSHSVHRIGPAFVWGSKDFADEIREVWEAIGGEFAPSVLECPHLFVVFAPEDWMDSHRLFEFSSIIRDWRKKWSIHSLRRFATLTILGVEPISFSGLAYSMMLEKLDEGKEDHSLGPVIKMIELEPSHLDRADQVRFMAQASMSETGYGQAAVVRGGRDELVARYRETVVRFQASSNGTWMRNLPRFHSIRSTNIASQGFPLSGTRWLAIDCELGTGFDFINNLYLRHQCSLWMYGGLEPLADHYLRLDGAEKKRWQEEVMRNAYAMGDLPNEAWERMEARLEWTRRLNRLGGVGQVNDAIHRTSPSLFYELMVDTSLEAISHRSDVGSSKAFDGVVIGIDSWGAEVFKNLHRKRRTLNAEVIDSCVDRLCRWMDQLPDDMRPKIFVICGTLSTSIGEAMEVNQSLLPCWSISKLKLAIRRWPNTRLLVLHRPSPTEEPIASKGTSSRSSTNFMAEDEAFALLDQEVLACVDEMPDPCREIVWMDSHDPSTYWTNE